MQRQHEAYALPHFFLDCATSNRPRQRVIASSLILLAGVLVNTACHKKISDADRVRQVVRKVAAAAGRRDFAAMIKPTSNDFVGVIRDQQQLSRKMVKMMLFRYLRRDPAPQVILRSIDVEVKNDSATARVLALVGRGPVNIKQLDQAQAQAMQFDLQLKKMDDDWKLTRAEYQPIKPKKLLLAE